MFLFVESQVHCDKESPDVRMRQQLIKIHIDDFSCLWWAVMFTSYRHYNTFRMYHVYSLFVELKGLIGDQYRTKFKEN